MADESSVSAMPPGKWWGWGDPAHRAELPADGLAMLRAELGPGEPATVAELEDVSVPPARPVPDGVAEIVGSEFVFDSHEHRVRRAAGSSYPDLVRLRGGGLEAAPDAVALPGDSQQVGALLELCAREGVAVVPFGGGTSVVGGVEPIAGPHDRLLSLDLRRLRGVAVDPVAMTATLGPGLRGPEAEAALNERGFTLGHFPQSFEYATIGGFAATRSAGQASTGYGRFDELVTALELITPAGPLRTLATPHTAAGPSLREVALGSEGVLGTITEVTVRVRPVPPTRRYEAWAVADFVTGREVMRALAQGGALPDVFRLSDEAETRISLGLSGASPRQRRLLDTYLRLRRRRGGCLMICGWEGEREAVERRHAVASRLLRAGGAIPLGAGAGSSWERGRFHGPYLRDELMDHGYMIETLETSHTWSRLDDLYRAVGEALTGAMRDQGAPGAVMCHVSHVYGDGASLYFTFASPRRVGAELDQWRAVKTAACEAIVTQGATITHHHAVGRDHAPYMEAEVGAVGLEALRALKERLDPAGVMNPGKLLPGEGAAPA